MFKTLILKSKKEVSIYIADTFAKRFLGYMFQKKPRYDGILIKPCSSIHTFFMRFPIDVLFLGDDMKVIKKIESLQKGKIIMPIKNCRAVLEGKSKMFKDIKEGEKINIMDF